MNISELIRSGKSAVVAGHHTRIFYDGFEFEVLARRMKNNPNSPYETRWYLGASEETAVEEFVKSEEQ